MSTPIDKRKIWGAVAQIGMALLGSSAVLLLALDIKWGFVVGICAQPFFYINSFTPKFQLGFFIAVNAFTFSWALGIYRAFFSG